MVFRRRFRRGRVRRRMVTRRFKKRTRRVPRKQTGNGPRFFKFRVVSNLNYGSQHITDDPTGISNFISVAGLFAWYRVGAIKLSFVPVANVIQMATPQQFNNRYTYVRHDWETPLATLTEDDMISTERVRIFSSLQRWSAYFKMRKTIPNVLAGNNQLYGWQPTAAPVMTQGLQIFTDATGGVNPAGRMIVTYYVAAKYRD